MENDERSPASGVFILKNSSFSLYLCVLIQKYESAFFICIAILALVCSAQVEEDLKMERKFDKQTTEKKASVDLYKIISLDNNTTYVNTTLTIQQEYDSTYSQRYFGLLQFLNEGQTYNTLNLGLTQFNPYPEFGFKAKHFNYLEVQDIHYYNVPHIY